MSSQVESLMQAVEAARHGDRTALGRVFETVLPELQAYVRLMSSQRIRERESTSDVVQSICRKILEDIGQFRGSVEAQFKKWLYTLALNKLNSRERFHRAEKRDRFREAEDDGRALLNAYSSMCTPSQQAVAREEVQRIEAAFDQLSPEYKSVLTMSCFMGMPLQEVAAELDRSGDAARKLLSRARARLARLMVTQ